MADFRTPIARVRGLGPARAGTEHWWHQRITAAANLFLVLWFAVSMVALAGADYVTVTWWIRDPFVTVLLVLFVGNIFYHLRLGLQVVVEDYVKSEAVKVGSLFALTFVCTALALLGIVAVLKVSFGG